MGLYMPNILKESGVVLLLQTATRVAIEYRSTRAGIGEPSEKILQGARIGESLTTTGEREYAPGFGVVAKERPHEERLNAKLEGMLAVQVGDVIDEIVILTGAIGFRQICIAA